MLNIILVVLLGGFPVWVLIFSIQVGLAWILVPCCRIFSLLSGAESY